MNFACDYFFAGSGFTFDKNVAVAVADHANRSLNLLHAAAAADHIRGSHGGERCCFGLEHQLWIFNVTNDMRGAGLHPGDRRGNARGLVVNPHEQGSWSLIENFDRTLGIAFGGDLENQGRRFLRQVGVRFHRDHPGPLGRWRSVF